jgi:hypothetical protein
MGTVSHSRSVAQKKRLVLETDLFPEGQDPLQALDLNRTRHRLTTGNGHDDSLDVDKDMAPLTPRLSNRTSGLSVSPPNVRRERTTPPSSPDIQLERRIPPSSPRTRRTTPSLPRTRHATPSSPRTRRTTPSSLRSEVNRDSLPPSHKRIKLPPAPFREGYIPGPKPKAVDYDEGVEKMLLKAMHEYACLVLSTDAFPNEVKQTQWAKATWQAACEEVGEHYECSVRMIRLVRHILLSLRIAEC